MYDVVIAGGGPAGLAAALMLGRVHRTVLLVDAGEGRNARAETVHNFLTRDGIPPDELRALGRRELAGYPAIRTLAGTVATAEAVGRGSGSVAVGTVTADEVEAVPAAGAVGGGFRVGLSGGGAVEGRRVLLATGLADELSGPRGVAELWGRSAFHCPYCHGYECTGLPVAVLGAGPARVRLALQLSRFAASVVLCTGGEPLAQDARETLSAYGVAVRCEPVTRLEGADGRLERIVFEGGPPLERAAVFVANVPRQRSDLAARLGCAAFADGCVEIDEFGRTSVPGVYAAGDMARRRTVPVPLAAVIAAAASGTLAGGAIDQDLLGEDFGLPDPFARREG
ncbi:FAD-dependent oxidoreductase [Nonomuraea fuscirosea]|uniref:NAD(P)/FAD-dependent oxidoreductase n=1 Tax=Nonomuraea fuscirosea TaxID=1291556 RepID=UPI002DDB1155|nr:FAD-dependent oxidoreductase [Nonomuraea fuscirosea]WSA54969.1 FAD-dependent oxidoreductase [Nonomuraea fuscirosea]